jgi:hypothetical protein
MGVASAYAAVLEVIERDVDKLLGSTPDIFSFKITVTEAARGCWRSFQASF